VSRGLTLYAILTVIGGIVLVIIELTHHRTNSICYRTRWGDAIVYGPSGEHVMFQGWEKRKDGKSFAIIYHPKTYRVEVVRCTDLETYK
jgi:hypothetical protein